MLKSVVDILESCDKGELTALVLLHFKKAFYLVDQKLLDVKIKVLNFLY